MAARPKYWRGEFVAFSVDGGDAVTGRVHAVENLGSQGVRYGILVGSPDDELLCEHVRECDIEGRADAPEGYRGISSRRRCTRMYAVYCHEEIEGGGESHYRCAVYGNHADALAAVAELSRQDEGDPRVHRSYEVVLG